MSPRQWCQFGALRISYDDRVLRPRPWTEMQSNWAAELSPVLPDGPILELCAGAGQIGLLAAALTRRPIVQVDVDANAAQFACDNAVAAGLSDRHEFRLARLEQALSSHERFPLILADPPYIPRRNVTTFPDDPVVAIDGGDDGLAVIATCLDVVAGHLTDTGEALLQVRGPAQADEVDRELVTSRKLRVVDTRSIDDARTVMRLQRMTE